MILGRGGPVPVPLCPPQIPLQLAWEQKPGRAPILLLLGVYT